MLLRPNRPVDENDVVSVHVIASRAFAGKVQVKRTSAIRSASALNILGVGTLNADKVLAAVRGGADSTLCDLTVALSDFAPGRGEVTMFLTILDDKTPKSISWSTFDFTVNPLYTGAFSLGPMRTWLSEPKFGTVVKGADTVATEIEAGAPRIQYALFFTPYVWGKRDIEKPETNPLKHLNPSLGLPLTEIGRTAIIAVTADLPLGIHVHAGWHFGTTTGLDQASDTKAVGDRVVGGNVPTHRRPANGHFIAIGLDLRVMAKLLQTAGSTAIP